MINIIIPIYMVTNFYTSQIDSSKAKVLYVNMVATLSLCTVEVREVEMNLYKTLLLLFHIHTVLVQGMIVAIATVSCLQLSQTFYQEQEEEHHH